MAQPHTDNKGRSWVVVARMNPKKFAEVHRALASFGHHASTRAETIGVAFDMLHAVLVQNKQLAEFDSNHDAHAYLEAFGLQPLEGQRGARRWVEGLGAEGVRIDRAGAMRAVQGSTPLPAKNTAAPSNVAPAPSEEDLSAMAARLLQGIDPDSIIPDDGGK